MSKNHISKRIDKFDKNYNLENKKIIITHQPRTDRSGSFLLVDLL